MDEQNFNLKNMVAIGLQKYMATMQVTQEKFRFDVTYVNHGINIDNIKAEKLEKDAIVLYKN